MTTAQKIIKYCAIAFAVFLIVSIIGGICGAIASISMLCGDEDVVGELNLTLVGAQEDYCITMDKGLGTAIINGVKMEDDTVYGSGETTVEVDGGVGELKIGFAPAADEKKEDENRN